MAVPETSSTTTTSQTGASASGIPHEPLMLNAESVQQLADTLYSVAVSNVGTVSPRDRVNLVNASRALRRLLTAYEREAGHELHTLLVSGGRI
jgi:transketolase C-terminal domain/subunit